MPVPPAKSVPLFGAEPPPPPDPPGLPGPTGEQAGCGVVAPPPPPPIALVHPIVELFPEVPPVFAGAGSPAPPAPTVTEKGPVTDIEGAHK